MNSITRIVYTSIIAFIAYVVIVTWIARHL